MEALQQLLGHMGPLPGPLGQQLRAFKDSISQALPTRLSAEEQEDADKQARLAVQLAMQKRITRARAQLSKWRAYEVQCTESVQAWQDELVCCQGRIATVVELLQDLREQAGAEEDYVEAKKEEEPQLRIYRPGEARPVGHPDDADDDADDDGHEGLGGEGDDAMEDDGMDGDATPIPAGAGAEGTWPSPRATPQQVAILGADEHLDQLIEQVQKRRRELSQPTQPAAVYELATPAQVEASQPSQRSRASRAEAGPSQASRGRRQRRSVSRSPRAPGVRAGSLVAATYTSDDEHPPALVAQARRRQALEQQCVQAKAAAAADAADTARQKQEAKQLALACQATARMAAAGAAEARAAARRGASDL